MWKYAKKLKEPYNNNKINHIHKKNSSATLQDTKISINSYGFRGTNFSLKKWNEADKKIIFLGSSVTLGWGVKEKDTLTNVIEELAKRDNKNWKVINAGVGNYNTKRYINNYFEFYDKFDPNVIIIQYFINDAEILSNKKGNFFTRNFHLGVELWKYISSLKDDFKQPNVSDYYFTVYEIEREKNIVRNELKKLKNHCDFYKIKCVLVFTPDFQLIKKYDLKFINEYIEEICENLDLDYFDLTFKFQDLDSSGITNVKYNDRHPNDEGHKIMANTIYKYLIN
jgi:lysophospholipase L1-like esterase